MVYWTVLGTLLDHLETERVISRHSFFEGAWKEIFSVTQGILVALKGAQSESQRSQSQPNVSKSGPNGLPKWCPNRDFLKFWKM